MKSSLNSQVANSWFRTTQKWKIAALLIKKNHSCPAANPRWTPSLKSRNKSWQIRKRSQETWRMKICRKMWMSYWKRQKPFSLSSCPQRPINYKTMRYERRTKNTNSINNSSLGVITLLLVLSKLSTFNTRRLPRQ